MRIQAFDYEVDLLQVILWQYAQASRLISLINQKQDWYNVNQKDFWQGIFDNVFNLATADDFGFAVWSYILNIPLRLAVTKDETGKPIWGFNEVVTFPTYINSYKNFGYGTFSVGGDINPLTAQERRLLLRLRYFDFVNRGDVVDINNFLAFAFEGFTGTCWALDGLDMTMVYVFTFSPSYPLRLALTQFDLLPRPAAVGIRHHVTSVPIWGFGLNYQNFEHGTFEPPFI